MVGIAGDFADRLDVGVAEGADASAKPSAAGACGVEIDFFRGRGTDGIHLGLAKSGPPFEKSGHGDVLDPGIGFVIEEHGARPDRIKGTRLPLRPDGFRIDETFFRYRTCRRRRQHNLVRILFTLENVQRVVCMGEAERNEDGSCKNAVLHITYPFLRYFPFQDGLWPRVRCAGSPDPRPGARG